MSATRRGAFGALTALAGATAIPTPAPAVPDPARTQGTLSALARALGELEPADPDGEMMAEHFERMDLVRQAAAILPVTSAKDAALTVSAAAETIGILQAFEHDAESLAAQYQQIHKILAQLGAWLLAQGAAPLRMVWTYEATPFPDLYPRPERAA